MHEYGRRVVLMVWCFSVFFLSGFCAILYELVWLRLAMAQFGVTTALVSIVLSMFMAGLGVGSWVAGKLVNRHGEQLKSPPSGFTRPQNFLLACQPCSFLGNWPGGITCWRRWRSGLRLPRERTIWSRVPGSR